jgi:long-chain acyl-CoA synthetase
MGREEVHAVVILESSEYDLTTIIRQVNEILLPHQRISSHSVWPEGDFPRTPTQKIKKKEVEKVIKKMAFDNQPPILSIRIDPFAKIIRDISRKKDLEIRGEMNIANDLGFDSLDRVELLSALEETYQVTIDEGEFIKSQNVKELKHLLKGAMRETNEVKIPRWVHTKPIQWLRILGQPFFFFPLIRFFCSIRVENRKNLRGLQPPFIVIANHVSHFDTPVILMSLPLHLRRNVAPLMMQEFFDDYFRPEGITFFRKFLVGFTYWVATVFFGGYPFPTEGDFRRSMEYTGELLSRKLCPLLFPEGERTNDGYIHKFKPGIGMMVLNMKVPVLSVRTEGLYGILPHDKYRPRRGKVTVKFGKVMRFDSGTFESIAEELESAVTSL